MSTSASRLRELRKAATPGKWTFHDSTDPRGHKGEFRAPSPHNGFMLVGAWTNDADAPLMALAPELAEWAADAAEELSHLAKPGGIASRADAQELLARLDGLLPEGGE